MNLEDFDDYTFEVNQKEILSYLHVSWNVNYNPNISEMLVKFRIDSLSVLEFFGFLIKLRNACLLSYRKESNCIRIIEHDSRRPNTNSNRMMEDLLEVYIPEEV